ncbi:MAG: TonB-dependent receptor plug domain-containing protein, partial [Pseudomonadales bacterium]|nr:TonB-dependent receptor plug domain-containing protein [Pseudomonadales bacterium]
MKSKINLILPIFSVLACVPAWGQQASESAPAQTDSAAEATQETIPGAPVDGGPAVDPGAADSTVVYEAEFFDQYNPITASDMLERIPGVNVFGGRGGGGRGLGTGGNLLINGQRIAGKDNSARDQLDRITAAEVERIEIIRDTSGELNVRGAGEVINIILVEVPSRSSTQVQLVNRLNHDDTYEVGGNVGWSTQIGNFQALVNLEARPNYENRDNREVRVTPEGEMLGTLFEENIRDQDEHTVSTNMSYGIGSHRMQLNALLSESNFPRNIRRDFVDFENSVAIDSIQQEDIDNEESNWELGGDYEYGFANGSRLAVLFVANDEIRNSVRERFEADPSSDPLSKNLFIDSQRETKEFIVQTNYNFSLTGNQSLRVGAERAITELDSKLFIASPFGSEPSSAQFGGLSLIPSISNPGTHVEETRYEGFAFH